MKLMYAAPVHRPTLRVTPDHAQADALRLKQAALSYTPLNGFHKDRKQDRLPSPRAQRWQLRSA